MMLLKDNGYQNLLSQWVKIAKLQSLTFLFKKVLISVKNLFRKKIFYYDLKKDFKAYGIFNLCIKHDPMDFSKT